MKRKSFVMTLSISALVILLGVSSCTKRKNPSSIVPSSETSISESISNSTSEAESTVGTSDSTSSEDSSTSEATSEQPSSEAVSSDEPSSEPSSEVVSSEEPSSEPSSEVVSSEEPSSEPSSEVVSSEDSNDTSSDSGSSEVTVKSTIKIGTANPVEMEEVDTDPSSPTQVAQYKYVIDVHAGDVLVFTHDGETVTNIGPDSGKNNLKLENNQLVVINDATNVSIYFKVWQNGGYSVWVEGYQAPVVQVVYAVTVNGEAVEESSLGALELGDNAKAFTITLEVGQKLVVKKDGTALKIGNESKTEFECTVAGTHKVYVNKSGQVWVTSPVAPVETVYTVTVNGVDTAITLIPDEENHAKFKLTLAVGDKVVVLGDGVALEGGAYAGTEYTVKAAGEHTFFVNADDKVYMDAPAEPVQVGYTVELNGDVVDKANLGEVALDGNQFAFSIDLKVGNVVVIKNNNEQVGKSFTCEIAGTHIFYVKDGVVYPVAPHHAKVTIGEAEAVVMEATVKGEEDTWVEQYKFTATSLTAGQELVFTYNGKAISTNIGTEGEGNNVALKEGKLLVVNDAENANIYFKVWQDGGFSVWVEGYQAPVVQVGYTVTVNGEAVEESSLGELELGDNAKAFTITLEVGQKLVVKNNGTALTIGKGTETEFECTVAGTHKVYVNKSGQVWVTSPVAPVETVYTVTVNGVDTAITLIPDEENHAKFKLTLAVGDKVVVLGDGVALEGGAYAGTEYTVKAAGEHTFFVNADDKVYMDAPALDPSDVTTVTLTFDFSALARNDERYAVYLFKGSNSEWVSLEDNNNVCTLTLTKEQVAKYTTIIFCRMNGSTTENNWANKWNQTEDLMIEGNNGKTYTITSWGTEGKLSGSWN